MGPPPGRGCQQTWRGRAAWPNATTEGPHLAVMDVMGWSNSAMVKRYAHVTAQLRRDIADRLDSFFWTDK